MTKHNTQFREQLHGFINRLAHHSENRNTAEAGNLKGLCESLDMECFYCLLSDQMVFLMSALLKAGAF